MRTAFIAWLSALILVPPYSPLEGMESSASEVEYKNAHDALTSLARITSKEVKQNSCSVTAVADFQEYTKHLSLFRETWLNKDYSLDFYNQRRKQVLIYVVLKRYAEIITEGLYTGVTGDSPNECSFEIEIKAQDLYGNTSQLPAISWNFNRVQSNRVVWDKIDPKDFPEIALNYRYSEYMAAWVSTEPSMSGTTGSKQELPPACDDKYLKYNAIFTRATVFCGKDYMDSRAGYSALAMSRGCFRLDVFGAVTKMRASIEEFDNLAQERGKAFACRWVDEIQKSVVQSLRR